MVSKKKLLAFFSPFGNIYFSMHEVFDLNKINLKCLGKIIVNIPYPLAPSVIYTSEYAYQVFL